MLLAKNPDGVSEVVNDLDGDLLNFWRVMADETAFNQFHRRVQAVPFSEAHWHDAQDAEASYLPCGSGGRLLSFAAANRLRVAWTPSPRLTRNRTRRGMNEQASAWLTAVEGLPAVHARLKRVVIVGPKDAKEVIQQQDGPNTLFYLDPPYLDETRTAPKVYRFEMTRDQHAELLDVVKAVKGKVMLSGYDSALYQEKLADWNRHAFELPNNAASGESQADDDGNAVVQFLMMVCLAQTVGQESRRSRWRNLLTNLQSCSNVMLVLWE